jgi:uncharacterized phage protein (TIGR01671 family)
MRSIKFRGWNTVKKIMYSAETLGADQLTINPDGRGFINVHGKSTDLSTFCDHIIPLQFTGLKDKTGKEIYEGDILKTESCPNVVVKFGDCHEFVDDGYYGWYCEYEGNHILKVCQLNSSINYTSTIIGNIHENPGLFGFNKESIEKE